MSPVVQFANAAILLIALTASSQQLRAEVPGEDPQELRDLTIIEHSNDLLPLDLTFRDDAGETVRLGDYFQGKNPVILSMNYSNCPMLCQVQLNGLVTGLDRVIWTAGQEYQVISVSIDPAETPEKALKTKEKYLELYGRPESADGWHFLTGDKASIQKLADAIGFQFRYVPERNEYAHPALLTLCTPDGRISRYMYGVEFPPQTLRLSLVEASEGKIGTTTDRFLLFCFHYDPSTGAYGPVAMNIMKVGGASMLAALLMYLAPYWLASSWFRRRRQAKEARKANWPVEENVSVTTR
ncbi:SCO family protein [Blastopirellula marina]|uniref:SCO1/SenC family protein n=1 Tax=Blastopirellula marina DSM 3645 TaxID=314230 RepID=A4A0M9_9BACT|nr:SCO family protein [Blastopirellula marina]EAQ77695.1 SCO1/SenC family protein [Blastopirellula marina DSM 3645]